MRADADALDATVLADRAAIENAEAAVRADRAAIENAKIQLGYCFIHSPMDGRTGSLLIQQGNLIKAEDISLVVIHQIIPIHVAFSVPEQFLLEIKKYMASGKLQVEALAPMNEERSEKGIITFVNNPVDSNTGTIRLKGTFANPEKKLWPGQFVNIVFPLNFASPYKSASIIEFWRRWHITLSRFLRDYLYIPLGGNRKGPRRRYVNLLITMLLGGFWHGAGWTYVVWGALHGTYLAVNHLWRSFRQKVGLSAVPGGGVGRKMAQAVTFLAVVVAWVFFRSEDLGSAWEMLRAMAGSKGFAMPASLHGLLPPLRRVCGPRR